MSNKDLLAQIVKSALSAGMRGMIDKIAAHQA